MKKQVDIYTDGACLGNPGYGGWGVLLKMGTHEKLLSGGEAETTNNRMELIAAIQGLEALKEPVQATLHTDSTYVKNGITQWINRWQKNGWKTADKKPVKNVDLWQRLATAIIPHDIKWQWVKGHAGHPENERVDDLAREAAEKIKRS